MRGPSTCSGSIAPGVCLLLYFVAGVGCGVERRHSPQSGLLLLWIDAQRFEISCLDFTLKRHLARLFKLLVPLLSLCH